MKTTMTVVLTLVAAALIGVGVVYSGRVGIGADEPHSGLTASLLGTARERAIARAAREVVVPGNLSDPKLIASGAGEYAEMCTECHLAPAMKETELRAGLNPRPPDFSNAVPGTPAEQFWIVKHGIKMTGMPAWGLTHDDERLWSMVAFLQKLPGLSQSDYGALVGSGEGGHHHHEGSGEESPDEESGEHSHEHADEPAVKSR